MPDIGCGGRAIKGGRPEIGGRRPKVCDGGCWLCSGGSIECLGAFRSFNTNLPLRCIVTSLLDAYNTSWLEKMDVRRSGIGGGGDIGCEDVLKNQNDSLQ